MENPEILGRIQIEWFIPVEIFQKKINTFRGTFSRFYKTTEIFCTICLDYQCQASCREKVKNLPVFCKWYNSILFLFLVPKKYQSHLTEIFHQNFCTNGRCSQTRKGWIDRPSKNHGSKKIDITTDLKKSIKIMYLTLLNRKKRLL